MKNGILALAASALISVNANAQEATGLLDARPYLIQEYFLQEETNEPYTEDFQNKERSPYPVFPEPDPVFSSSTSIPYTDASIGYFFDFGNISNIAAGELFLVAMFQGSLISEHIRLNLEYMLTTVDFDHNILNGVLSIRNKAGISADFFLNDFVFSAYANSRTRHSAFTPLDRIGVAAGARACYHAFDWLDVFSFYEHSWQISSGSEGFSAGFGLALFL